MSRFIKVALGLTAAIFLATTLQAGVAMAKVSKPGPLLLAQKVEPEKAKASIPESPPQKPEMPKAMKRPRPQPGQVQRRTRSMGPRPDELERAGTKKIGGQPIRAKDTPQGE
jgi:hypothetical protein